MKKEKRRNTMKRLSKRRKNICQNQAISAHTGCPGSRIMQIQRTETPETDQSPSTGPQISRLQNWPVQIKLAPVHAPYFNGAKLFDRYQTVLRMLTQASIRILCGIK